MRPLILSLILLLATLGTLGAPPAAQAQHLAVGYRPGAYPAWRGGSHYRWPGGSHYAYRGGLYTPGYAGGLYFGNYGYYRPGVSIGVGVYPYASYGYTSPALDSYWYSGYDYADPAGALSVPDYRVTPSPSAPAVMPPASDAAAPPPSSAQPAATDARASVRVLAPADSQVLFNGMPTRQTGEERQFVTPPLAAGQTYRYAVEARWTDNGRPVDQTRTVTVTAGAETIINFNVPDAATGPEVLPSPGAPR